MGWKVANVLMNLLGVIAISLGSANYAMTTALQRSINVIDVKLERHLGEHDGKEQAAASLNPWVIDPRVADVLPYRR